MIQTKTWISMFFVLGAFMQLAGFTARVFSTQDSCNRTAYGIQSVLLLLGPSSIMISVNLVQTVFYQALDAENFCWVSITWQRIVYPTLNAILIILQAIGGIMVVGSSSRVTIASATKLTIAIYVAQTFFWAFTLAENIYMSIRLCRDPTEASQTLLPRWRSWNQLFGLSISIIGLGRNVMRLTMAGGIAFLVENEWPAYAFDGYQMVVVLGAWVIWYLPGQCRGITSKPNWMHLMTLERRETPQYCEEC
ncbi:uncharacterized protein N7443_003977 [Penicillium atrosanguineum]|uniref:Uncharacterized protein n=1 Tax=Penicillium atrosanguineum TaxID=1132637 RepID=A0A9W9U865_9EURO|nr:uncharacterized protein N7443_003977 [Penicillium atrosanguineum]KAJ5304317.1 hypothetical protein N7443_003977 [Penicillium atrosanguineum]KAJ5323792.1 hypothetical protein N7476_002392 [Penicillium atrosanguineum]